MAVHSLLILFSIYHDLSTAIAAAAHIDGTLRMHGADVDGAVVLARDPHGSILVHEVGTLAMPPVSGRGAVLGAVIGQMFSPSLLTSAFLEASITELVNRLDDRQLNDPTLRKVGDRLKAEQAALLVVGSEDAVNQIADAQMGYQSLVRRHLSPKFVSAARERR